MSSCCCRCSRVQLSDLLLEHNDPKLFTKSQWSTRRRYFLAYRVLVSCYLLTWLVLLLGKNLPTKGARTFIFLSEWSFIVVNCYFLSAAVTALYYTCKHTNQTQADTYGAQPDSSSPLLSSLESSSQSARGSNQLPWYFQLTWFLFSVSTGALTMITAIYWPLLFTNRGKDPFTVAIEFHVHLVSTVLLLVDLCVSAIPMCFCHCLFPMCYGALYVIFSLVYWAVGGTTASGSTAIYPILDWEEQPLRTTGFIALAGVLIVVGYALFYGVYRLRVKIFVRYYGNRAAADFDAV